jgi:diguanylate cyclase (GGDEF)-like protein
MNILASFRRQTVARKLTLSALALLGPMAVLGFFMDLSFRYDINICRTELAGTRTLRPAFRLLHAVAEHQATELAASDLVQPDANPNPAYGDTAATTEKVRHALDDLADAVEREAPVLMDSPSFVPEDSEIMDIPRLRDAWHAALKGNAPSAYDELIQRLMLVISAVSDCANLALDPALDSHALATATALTLPRTCRLLSALETTALELAAETSAAGGGTPVLIPERRDRIMRRLGLLEDGLLAETVNASRRALMEDANFYDSSPGLQEHYPPVLARFRTSVARFAEAMRGVCNAMTPPYEAALAARSAHDDLAALASVGLDELDGLIQRRMASYQRWRMFGAGSSGLTALLALGLLIVTSRHLSKSVMRGLEYVQRVSAGDYAAEVDDSDFGRDLAEYTDGVRRMVATLKHQLGSLDGVLRNMTVPCLVVDREERLTFVNRPYLDLFERRGEAGHYLGMTLRDFFYSGGIGETILGRAMREGKTHRGLEMALRSPSGRNLTIRYDAAPLYDLDGVLIGGFAVIVDLTEKQEQQEEIARLAAFPRENPSPVLSTEENGDIIYMNPAAGKTLDALSLSPEQLLPPNHAEIVRAVLSTQTSRLNVEATAGDRTYTWAYHPVPGQRQTYIYGLDISERKRMELQLAHDALHDGLTGLPNRTLFLDRVKQALHRSRREAGRRFALLFLDLDRFKNINDSLGHAAGDDLLIQFAERLENLLRSEDTVARLGGDEFTVLLDNLSGPGRALVLAERVHGLLAAPFLVQDHELFVTASIGVVIGPDNAAGPDELLRNADTAMYRAKAAGRARSALYDELMHNEARDRLLLEMDMKRGLEKSEFEPFFQPIVDLKTRELHGFEALARWNHPRRGLVSPAEFIPLAEETGLIAPLGRIMLDLSLERLRDWRHEHPQASGLSMSVNLSVAQMTRADILDEVEQALKRHGVPPDRLKIELTESGLMDNASITLSLLEKLHDMDVRLSIDDFGTGYSSLSQLSRFPFAYLKIDQSFVRSMLENNKDMAIVRTIVALAHSLDKRIIAEGVETPEQLTARCSLGCHFGQGYLFSRPVPADQARDMTRRSEPWF